MFSQGVAETFDRVPATWVIGTMEDLRNLAGGMLDSMTNSRWAHSSSMSTQTGHYSSHVVLGEPSSTKELETDVAIRNGIANLPGVISPGCQEGDAQFVCVRSILDDISKPASEIEAAQALLAITTSMEELKDHLSYDDNLVSDDDLSVEGAHSILSRRSNGSKRSQGSKRSDGSKRSFGSRHSFGSRQQMARSNLAALLAVKLRKRGDHGLPRAPSLQSIPLSERPPLTIHFGKSVKSDSNENEIDIEEVDDNDILDPDQEHPCNEQENADATSLYGDNGKLSPSSQVVTTEFQDNRSPCKISQGPDDDIDNIESTGSNSMSRECKHESEISIRIDNGLVERQPFSDESLNKLVHHAALNTEEGEDYTVKLSGNEETVATKLSGGTGAEVRLASKRNEKLNYALKFYSNIAIEKFGDTADALSARTVSDSPRKQEMRRRLSTHKVQEGNSRTEFLVCPQEKSQTNRLKEILMPLATGDCQPVVNEQISSQTIVTITSPRPIPADHQPDARQIRSGTLAVATNQSQDKIERGINDSSNQSQDRRQVNGTRESLQSDAGTFHLLSLDLQNQIKFQQASRELRRCTQRAEIEQKHEIRNAGQREETIQAKQIDDDVRSSKRADMVPPGQRGDLFRSVQRRDAHKGATRVNMVHDEYRSELAGARQPSQHRTSRSPRHSIMHQPPLHVQSSVDLSTRSLRTSRSRESINSNQNPEDLSTRSLLTSRSKDSVNSNPRPVREPRSMRSIQTSQMSPAAQNISPKMSALNRHGHLHMSRSVVVGGEASRQHQRITYPQDDLFLRIDHNQTYMRPLTAELEQNLSGRQMVGRVHGPPTEHLRRNLPETDTSQKTIHHPSGIPFYISFDPKKPGRSISPYSEKDDKELDLNELASKLNCDPVRDFEPLTNSLFHQVSRPSSFNKDRLNQSGNPSGDFQSGSRSRISKPSCH